MKNRTIIIVITFFLILSIGTLAVYIFLEPQPMAMTVANNNIDSAHYNKTITLTENGFSPKDITIKKGDVIRFMTTANLQFWPASDPHPTHELFPEFDPQEPINPDQSWLFTFTKPGTWKFHNHLDPTSRGTIIVK